MTLNSAKSLLTSISRLPSLQYDIHITQTMNSTNSKIEKILAEMQNHNFVELANAIKIVLNWDKRVNKWKNFSNTNEKSIYQEKKEIIDDLIICLNKNQEILDKKVNEVSNKKISNWSYKWEKTLVRDILFTYYDLVLKNNFCADQRLNTLSEIPSFQLSKMMKKSNIN